MSGRGRLAVCATLATLAAACALLPLVSPPVWLLQAALLVGVQAVVGAAARRVPLARPLTVAAQAVVSLLLIVLIFARPEAVAGVLPGPEAFRALGDLLNTGVQDVGRYSIPAPVTDGIKLLLLSGVLLIGLLVDALAVTYRSAAPAGLPLLALYSVAAGLATDGTRWLWFMCAAGGYLLLLLAEGRERLSQWGRIFGDPARPGPAVREPGGVNGPAVSPVRTGRRIGAVSLGIALVVPALLPSMSGGLLDSMRGTGTGPSADGGTVSAVNPLVALQDSLNQPDNRTVLTYRTDNESAQQMYLRIVALDKFDGAAWKPSERRITEVPNPLPAPRGLSPDVKTQKVRTSVSAAEWYAQNWLPMPFPASRVDIEGRWRFEPEGRTLVGDRGQTTRGVEYQVESLLAEPTPAQLAAAPEPDRGLLEEYTRVPDSLPEVVRRTALEVTGGSPNDYRRAVRLQQWFADEGGFTYDTEVRAGSGTAAIANFLEQKEGFCVHFAFSMAAMARTLDIPARVAVGFTPGTVQGDGRTEVGLQDAHAWPELYFEGVGWTRFEPTPSRGSAPSYALPDTPDAGTDDDTQLPARPNTGETPEPAPTPTDGCTRQEKRMDPLCGQTSPAGGGGSSDGGFPLRLTVTLGLGALLLLGLPALPLLWRIRMRARRLGTGAGALPAWRELVDTGWDYGVVPDEAATPRKTAARIARIGELGPEAAESAHRVALAVERVLYAADPGEEAAPVEDVRAVRAALREAASRRLRTRALLLPRSTVRTVWAVTERWRSVTDRWRSALQVRFAK